jgi:hypothetical protein
MQILKYVFEQNKKGIFPSRKAIASYLTAKTSYHKDFFNTYIFRCRKYGLIAVKGVPRLYRYYLTEYGLKTLEYSTIKVTKDFLELVNE